MKKVSLKGADMKPETEKAKKVYRSVPSDLVLVTCTVESTSRYSFFFLPVVGQGVWTHD